jgi:hypothetical protein
VAVCGDDCIDHDLNIRLIEFNVCLQEEQDLFSKILDLTYNLIKDDVIVSNDSDVSCLQSGVLAALNAAITQLRSGIYHINNGEVTSVVCIVLLNRYLITCGTQ